ncbi:MAG TPA: CvpA family protein, partial [Salinimicrobium sp.]|nr:CvpA family protein [Salinimicrobium sp.]
FGAIHFSDVVYVFLQKIFSWEEQYLYLISFALTFILIVIAISIVGRILTKMVNFIALGIVNKLLGAVFGLIKMAFLASVFFMFLNQMDAFSLTEETRENSVLYGPVAKIAPILLPTILTEIQESKIYKTEEEEI